MTLHIYMDYSCEDCGTPFLPIETWRTCPKCGKVADTIFPLAERVYESGVYNKYPCIGLGSHTPGVWAVLSLGDHMALWGFSLFDWLDAHPNGTFKYYLFGQGIPTGVQGEYVKAVLKAFYDEYQRNHQTTTP